MASFEVRSIKFIFEDDWTEVEVVCSAASDGTIGVQGVHKKTFRKERSALDILENEIAEKEYLSW